MLSGAERLRESLAEKDRQSPSHAGELGSLLDAIGVAATRISWRIGQGRGGRRRPHGESTDGAAALGEPLFDIADDIVRSALDAGKVFTPRASQPVERASDGTRELPPSGYVLAFDPLDAAGNVEVNVGAGSLFSLLAAANEGGSKASSFLQKGTAQVAAGYAVYGPTTMVVLTLGHGVNGYTLDKRSGDFVLTHADLVIPPATSDVAVDTSHARSWEAPIQRYVDQCVQGPSGIRAKDFRLGWLGSHVAELHRVLLRGGVFVGTKTQSSKGSQGDLPLVFDANPLAMLVEQAGGAASTGRHRVLDIVPSSLDERVPVLFGSRDEVETLERYHRDHDDGLDPEFKSPLFNARSLFPSGLVGKRR